MLSIYSRDTLPGGCITNAPEQTIIIAVNCEGAMGRGTALALRDKYPELYHYYKDKCKRGEFHINYLLSARAGDKRFLLLPTKDKWRERAKLEEIKKNIDKLCMPETLKVLKVESIATTYLGTGNGWLKGEELEYIHRYLEEKLDALDIRCSIYA